MVETTSAVEIRYDQVWQQISAVHERVADALERALFRRHHLRLSEYRALSSLACADLGSLRVQDLVEAVALNQSSVSRIIARLEGEGLCERCVCPDDRRGVFARITDAGRLAHEASAVTYRETVTEEFMRLGLTVDHPAAGLRLTIPSEALERLG